MLEGARFFLDVAGTIEGTDKTSVHVLQWDYLTTYEKLFAEWRDQPINVIEIGVLHGASLRLCSHYFSKATLIGIDIREKCRQLAGGRVVIEIGSQDDPVFLRGVADRYPPTILIDDGSHQAYDMVFTFEQMFPCLADGGVYVVEDLSFQINGDPARWNVKNAPSAVDYFFHLSRSMLSGRVLEGTARSIVETVESVTFIKGAAIVRKKRPRADEGAVAFGLNYIETTKPASESEARLRLVEYILKHEGPLDVAEGQCAEALSLSGETDDALAVRAQLRLKQDRPDEAVADAARAAEFAPSNEAHWLLLARMVRARSGAGAAADALRPGVEKNPENARLKALLSALERA